ncbi:hypothetical protein P154DRAFT_536878 [Amniculicola lignicola CBS 123094]|uniref:Uncharacterized protein n=1 Tax=Amniculicola lignicola CBS 123094 TaxID=1392246 RepID=A0A6A5WAM8_9PLEO|nr:hypothetical protein P154DRAFT_536878 [Amniculicola lignicola CBS 123094]
MAGSSSQQSDMHFSQTDNADESNANVFQLFTSDQAIRESIVLVLSEVYMVEDGSRVELPKPILEGLEFFMMRLHPDYYLEDNARYPEDNPPPTPSTPTAQRHRSPPSPPSTLQDGGKHARRLFEPLLQLQSKDLDLHPSIKSLLRLPPQDFFTVRDALPLSRQATQTYGAQMTAMFSYTQALNEGQLADQARSVVTKLALHASINNRGGSKVSSSKYAPRIDNETLDHLYDSLDITDADSSNEDDDEDDAEANPRAGSSQNTTLTRSSFKDWFRTERVIADRYAYIADKLGDAAVLALLPHISERDVLRGFSKRSKICTQAMNHLQNLGVNRLIQGQNGVVQELKQHYEAQFRDLFHHIRRLEKAPKQGSTKRKAGTGTGSGSASKRRARG